MKVENLEDAKKKIKKLEAKVRELEKELEKIKAENECLKSRSVGRKKHDEKWSRGYNDFIIRYESGESLMEIVNTGSVSRRTAYRYLEYYKQLQTERNKVDK